MRSMFKLILAITFACILFTAWCFYRILPFPTWGKGLFALLYLGCFLLFFVRYVFRNGEPPLWLGTATYLISTSWMIFFVYALLLFAALWLGRAVGLVPAGFLKDSAAGSCTVIGIITVLLTYGYFHYQHKYREVIDIQTDKPLEKPLTLVLASDLHVGYHNRKAELGRWCDLFNRENPDLILIAGDILDGDLYPVNAWHYEEEFRRLRAPVYACLGNHEYISGESGSEAFYDKAGIHLLRDSAVRTAGIRIVGRDDRSNRDRLPLEVLCPQEDTVFTLLLDHQPYHLEEAEAAGVDFQFSGHTHHGQIWPGNWITDAMYEKAFGPLRRGATRYYVSSGLGIWGGQFRIGSRSEYIVLRLHGRRNPETE